MGRADNRIAHRTARTGAVQTGGLQNFCGLIPFSKTAGQASKLLPSVADYLAWYAKARPQVKYRQQYLVKEAGQTGATKYRVVRMADGDTRQAKPEELADPSMLAQGAKLVSIDPLTSQEFRKDTTVPFEFEGREYHPGGSAHWKVTVEGLERLSRADRLKPEGNSLRYVRYLDDFPVFPLTNIWNDVGGIQSRSDPKVYVVQTSTTVVTRCLLMSTDPGDLVLDPTCGSGTTAYVAEQWGRRWITLDTSRVALTLARTRLMSAKYPYYLLADSPEGVAKEAAITGLTPPPYETRGDVRKGFVYKRVPHITLEAIANNPDIKEGMTREEIDAAIARHADTETLFDQPYEDKKRIRVAGPLTVESLSPHRVLSPDEERPAGEREAQRKQSGDFVRMVIDNLRKAGVQNRIKDERLDFERLEPFAGEWIQAEGEYSDKSGTAKRVAVSIGGQYETVGPDRVKEAAKEALRGTGFDVLVVCGMAFSAHAGETAKEFEPELEKQKDGDFAVAEDAKDYGKLPVLLARMNPDLAMGDELLKKTGAGNLFMVFGEPDLEIEKQDDGKLIVEIRGVDVYDPTTGEVRSNTTDEIACWFIDTNYNDESFFVRHAYFTGADEPYDRLKRALRAEIDEEAWSTLYSTRSFPFDPPETGKIAVKVINHYGDEVLKVYEV